MAKRTSINVAGFAHGQQPIPAACRVGPLVTTGGVHGADPNTGVLPEALEDEVRVMFQNLSRIMAAAGGSLDDVARITVYVRSLANRAAVNGEWVAIFPDAESRPARHTILNEHLAGTMRVQCDALAFVIPKEEA